MFTNPVDTGSLRELVSSGNCLSCDVCCRFIDEDAPLRPYFTGDEILGLIEAGISPAPFKRLEGCKVDLIPYKDLYICPFFRPEENRCSIYKLRPLDCRIYPVALMRARDGAGLLAGVDTKCRFLKDVGQDDIKSYADLLSPLIKQETASGIIGEYQEDVKVIIRLDSDVLRSESRISMSSCLRPLNISDKPVFDSFLFGTGRLSSHSFITNYIWIDIFNYWWGIIEGCLCLFAEYDQNIFMPMPPLGNNRKAASAAAFELMGSINRNPSISRIENLDENDLAITISPGYRYTFKGYEYIYKRDDLVSLKGNAFKAKRSSVNIFMKNFKYTYEPFTPHELDACLLLYAGWMKERYKAIQDHLYRGMLYDSYSAHRRVMIDYEDLDIRGRIIRYNDAVAGYTFGFKLGKDMVVVLLEIADRSAKGLPQFIFKEFCKEFEGVDFVNTMDDSGIENIRRTKLSYHPCRLEPAYIMRLP